MDASLEDRKKQIKEIRRTLDIARYSTGSLMSLRMNRASSFALLGVASVFALEWIAEHLGWPREQARSFTNSFIFGSMPLMLGGAVGFYLGLKTAKYKTYSAKLYALLAAYEPVDLGGYRKLQEAARGNTISYDSLSEWWYVENALVMGPPAPSEDDAFKARFVEKSPENASTQFSSAETGTVQAGPRDYVPGRQYIYRRPATDTGFLPDDPIHRIVLETRYALEAAAERLRIVDDQKGHEVGVIANALPYFWSGGRDIFDPGSAERHIDTVGVVVARYGIALPTTREDALPLLLRLSAHLLDPHPNHLLEQLQSRHGLTKSA